MIWCEQVEYADGDKVITEGENGDAFYIVETGSVQVTKLIDGVDKKMVCFIRPFKGPIPILYIHAGD